MQDNDVPPTQRRWTVLRPVQVPVNPPVLDAHDRVVWRDDQGVCVASVVPAGAHHFVAWVVNRRSVPFASAGAKEQAVAYIEGMLTQGQSRD